MLRKGFAGAKPVETVQRSLAYLREVSAILDAKAPGDAPAFKAWLSGISQKVAEASKEGSFLGIGKVQVSDAEKATLADISKALGISAGARSIPSKRALGAKDMVPQFQLALATGAAAASFGSMSSPSNWPSNRLLLALPSGPLKGLMPALEPIPCELGQILLDADSLLDNVFFPDSGVVSVVGRCCARPASAASRAYGT